MNADKTDKKPGKARILFTLFLSTLKLSAFTFGGGYVIVTLMRKRFVEQLKWITEDEMLDIVAMAQSAPGPMAVNASVQIGYRMAGVPGALITLLGTLIPPLVIISIISVAYNAFKDNFYVQAVLKGMQAGVSAIIADVVISMAARIIKSKTVLTLLIMLFAFLAVAVFKVSVLIAVGTAALLGLLFFSRENPKKGDKWSFL